MRFLLLLLVGCLFDTNAAPAQTSTVPYRFANVAIVAGGFITGFVAQPAQRGLYYVRTDIGGAYRWDAAEQHWAPLQDWLPFSERNRLGVESLAVDPTDAKKLYIAVGTYTNPAAPDGALLRSDDEGRHFEAIPLPFKLGGNEPGRFAGERLAVDPNHPATMFMGTRQDGLWRSNDAGLTWARVASFPAAPLNDDGLTFVTFDRTSGAPGQPTPVVLVGVSNGMQSLLRSNDGGLTWAPVAGGPSGMFPNHGVAGSNGTVYLSYTDAPGPNDIHNGAVWTYSPRSGAWRDITPEKPSGAGFGYGTVAIDPAHPETVLTSTIDRWQPGDTIFRSTDGGAHWTSLKENASRDATLAPWTKHTARQPPFGHWIGALLIDPFDPAHVLYGTGETIWESHDAMSAATHWAVGAPGLEETADITLLSPDLPGTAGPHLFTGLGDIGCFRHDDLARSPAGGAMKDPELSNCDSIALAANHPSGMVRVGRRWTPGPHGAVSEDGGGSWTPFASEPTGGERGGDAAIAADGKLLLWSIPAGPLALSADRGAHWRVLEAQSASHRPLQVLADARAPERFWVYDAETGTLRTLDGATGQMSIMNAKAPAHARLRIASQAPGTLWLAGAAGLWRSADGGTTWDALPSVGAAYAVGFGKAAPGSTAPAIYLAGALAGTPDATPRTEPGANRPAAQGAIYRSLDDGASWQEIDDPEHRYAWVEQITGDPRIFGRVYFGTNGRGVLWGDPAP